MIIKSDISSTIITVALNIRWFPTDRKEKLNWYQSGFQSVINYKLWLREVLEGSCVLQQQSPQCSSLPACPANILSFSPSAEQTDNCINDLLLLASAFICCSFPRSPCSQCMRTNADVYICRGFTLLNTCQRDWPVGSYLWMPLTHTHINNRTFPLLNRWISKWLKCPTACTHTQCDVCLWAVSTFLSWNAIS